MVRRKEINLSEFSKRHSVKKAISDNLCKANVLGKFASREKNLFFVFFVTANCVK